MAGFTLVRSVDPKLTERFLLSQPDVLDASVWLKGDLMHAHVTVADAGSWTPKGLQRICLEELGITQTPRELVLVASRRIAA